MAGRPATVRGGGLTGLHYGLIAFVVISLVSLAGFILQLTKVKEATERAASVQRRLDKYGRPPAPIGTYCENEATARGTTVFSVLGTDRDKMAELIAGTKDTIAPSLEEEVNGLLAQIADNKPGVVNPGDTLLTAVRKLDEQLTQANNTNHATATELAEKKLDVESLTQQLKAARDQYESQVEQLTAQHEQDRQNFADQLSEKETQLADIQNTLEVREQQLQQLQREGATDLREKQLELDRANRQIADLQKNIQALKGSFDADAILKKADGRVRRALPGSDVVYIDLGAKEGINVGMTFEVYPQLGGPTQSIRGKASLEVATVMEDTAECRVTRTTAGQPIIEGDIVVNIAYEQNRKPKFVVRGDFDLNYDGQIDAFGGVDQIEAIIRQWGGQVVPELDESIDFVVIGVPPRPGEVPAGASDIVRDQAERRLLERTEFGRLIDQARSMYIPVITQNQFLFLTGYAGDGVTRER
ncbi:MAG: hypothetical protein PVJ57_14715 [Phycisphaerae bacterium]